MSIKRVWTDIKMPGGKIDSPLITIITVVYNGEKYLEETIRNVLNQAYRNLEYIIIDGGSTDGTVDIIRKYEDRISYWISEKDDGIYDAMNKGWAAAKDNSYILFLGAGDKILSLPDDMEELKYSDVIFGKVRMGDKTVCNSTVDFKLRFCNTLHHQALLVNKAVSSSPPFDSRLRLYGDFDFNQRLYKRGVAFACSATFLSYALPDGASKKVCYPEYCSVIRKNYGLFWALLMFVLEPSLRVVKFLQKIVFSK